MNEIMNIKIYLDLMHKCYHDIMEDIVDIDFVDIVKTAKKIKVNPNVIYKERCNESWAYHYNKFEKSIEAIFGDEVPEHLQPPNQCNAEA